MHLSARVKRRAVWTAPIVAIIVWLSLTGGGRNTTRFLLLGLGGGALIAAIGLGTVLTFRGSGFINFGNGAVAMYAGYVYASLRANGTLIIPPLPNPLAIAGGPGIPTKVHLGDHVGAVGAVLIALAVSALLGVVIHYGISRPLRHAPLIARVVASVGILLLLQAIIDLRFGTSPIAAPSFLPKTAQHLWSHIVIPRDQLVLAAIVLVITAILWAVFRYTVFGLSTTAAASNEKGAVLTGLNPNILALGNWVLGTVIAGLMGVLATSINRTIDPETIALLIVPALGAALIGRFSSFWVTTLAGLGFGMSSSLITYVSTFSWFPQSQGVAIPGVSDALPFLVIIVVLVIRGRSVPSRADQDERMPFAPRPTYVRPRLAIAVIAAVAGVILLSPAWRLGVTNSMIGFALCLSVVVLTGFVGQISLMQMTIAGIAGFAMSNLTERAHVPFPFGPIIAVVCAVAAGLIAALPALRIRGANLAIVTLAAAVAVENMVFTNPTWAGGQDGAPVRSPEFLGLKFGPNDQTNFKILGVGPGRTLPNPEFGLFVLAIVVALGVGVVCVRRSATGRRFLAVRANERAAAGVAVGLARTKLLAFGMSALIAGIAGVLSAYRFGSVTPEYFGSTASLTLLAFAVLGGLSSVSGAVIGGLLVSGGVIATGLQDWFHLDPQYTGLIGGVGLIVTTVVHPGGLASAYRQLGGFLASRWRTRGGGAPEGVPAGHPVAGDLATGGLRSAAVLPASAHDGAGRLSEEVKR